VDAVRLPGFGARFKNNVTKEDCRYNQQFLRKIPLFTGVVQNRQAKTGSTQSPHPGGLVSFAMSVCNPRFR
jgi:hypothetical protein